MESEFFSATKLPKAEWDFYWEHTYLPIGMKDNALRLVLVELKMGPFSKEFALTRTTCFYGPPGCGKTTTVKALCNEVSKRLEDEQCYFAELRFYNLSSQNYGESEKLIAKAFKHIRELASANCIVFILLDEVESILIDRKLTLSNANPVDAFRGVNEVLKEIDDLALNYPKVFCFATSNFLSAVDGAFIDRLDKIFCIDLPDDDARSSILKELFETMNKNFSSNLDSECKYFKDLVWLTNGFSGRQLRKLIVDSMSSSDLLVSDPSKISFNDLFKATNNIIESRIQKEFQDRQNTRSAKND